MGGRVIFRTHERCDVNWEPIAALTDTANTLETERWAVLTMIQDNPGEANQLWGLLDQLDRQVAELRRLNQYLVR